MKLCVKNIFSTKKGSATGIALGFSAGVMVVSLGTVAVVSNTLKENKNVENSNVAYFSAERGIEYSLLDLSGHLSGYEVKENSEKGLLKTKNKHSKTQINIKSRSHLKNNTIVVPAKGLGDTGVEKEWNSLPREKSITIPLYIDNTEKN